MIAVAAPAAIIAALFALLFILAWQQFGGAIVRVLSINLPVIGNVIGNLVSAGFQAAYLSTVYWFDAAIAPLAGFIESVVAAPILLFNSTLALGQFTYNTLDNIVQYQIPFALNQGYQYTQALFGFAESAATALFDQADQYAATLYSYATAAADQEFAQANQYAATLYSYATAAADQEFARAEADIATTRADLTNLVDAGVSAAEAFTVKAYDAATGYALTLANGVEADLANAVTHVEQYALSTATNLVGTLATDIDNTVGQVLGGIYTDVDQAIADVLGVAGTADADVINAIKAIPGTVPLDLAGLVALVGANALTLTRFLRDCGLPNCRNLSDLGTDLQKLLGLVGDASFLAFLVELIDHPSNAKATIDGVFGGTVDTVVGGFRSLVGI